MNQGCRTCGAQLPTGALYCPGCGRSLKSRRQASGAVTTRRRQRPSRHRLLSSLRDPSDAPERHLWDDTFSAKGLVHQWLLLVCVTVAFPIAGMALPLDSQGWPWLWLALAVAWLGTFLWLAYLKLDVHYVLTDQRLLHQHGILTRLTRRIEVIDIDDVSYRQGILERLIGVGTIEIVSSDVSDPFIELPGIDHVREVAERIDQARRAERVRRGLHLETV